MTKLRGYRTILFNLANAAVLGMDAAKLGFDVPDAWVPYWMGCYVAGNILLRLVTTTPVGKT